MKKLDVMRESPTFVDLQSIKVISFLGLVLKKEYRFSVTDQLTSRLCSIISVGNETLTDR